MSICSNSMMNASCSSMLFFARCASEVYCNNTSCNKKILTFFLNCYRAQDRNPPIFHYYIFCSILWILFFWYYYVWMFIYMIFSNFLVRCYFSNCFKYFFVLHFAFMAPCFWKPVWKSQQLHRLHQHEYHFALYVIKLYVQCGHYYIDYVGHSRNKVGKHGAKFY